MLVMMSELIDMKQPGSLYTHDEADKNNCNTIYCVTSMEENKPTIAIHNHRYIEFPFFKINIHFLWRSLLKLLVRKFFCLLSNVCLLFIGCSC